MVETQDELALMHFLNVELAVVAGINMAEMNQEYLKINMIYM